MEGEEPQGADVIWKGRKKKSQVNLAQSSMAHYISFCPLPGSFARVIMMLDIHTHTHTRDIRVCVCVCTYLQTRLAPQVSNSIYRSSCIAPGLLICLNRGWKLCPWPSSLPG